MTSTLRTYLGIAPGVGKTYAMLRDGRARQRAGTDTVVAYWERHGRSATAAQLDDLEVIPTRTVTYRDASFAELDVDAVLARRPQLALVDELAHAKTGLAQLWLDDSVPDPVAAFGGARGISEPVHAPVIAVALAGSPADEWLIRYAAHLAGLSDAKVQGVYVRAMDNLDRPPATRLERDRELLGELGGTLTEVRAGDIASGLIRAARQAGAGQLVIGSRRRPHWPRLLSYSTVADEVLRAAGNLPVQVVNVGRPDQTSHEWPPPRQEAKHHRET